MRFRALPRLALLAPSFLIGQYAPNEVPRTWTFAQPTPAYSLTSPHEKLGDFQAGIKVDVLDADPSTGQWKVSFKRVGHPSIESLIDTPNLAEADPQAFARIAEKIQQFPLLHHLLASHAPWSGSPWELARQLFGDQDSVKLSSGTEREPQVLTASQPESLGGAWSISPLAAYISFQGLTQITIEFWNKGDAFLTDLDPALAHQILAAELAAIEREFKTAGVDPMEHHGSASINAVRVRETVFLLPNDLKVSLKYDRNEYLLLSIQSIRAIRENRPKPYEPSTFKERIASMVQTSQDGHRYIRGVPMIDQGEKGYCAAATLARVLQFYGYAIDQHAMAELAETEAQLYSGSRGGTLRKNMISAMRRICNSTPFRLQELDKARPEAILEVIEQGIPIIWFIPGHARLLIGLNPENNHIVFSDSWGLDHAYKTATWDYFANANREMWYLTPR